MRRVDGVVGNVHDDADLAARIDDHEDAGTLERVVLDGADRRKSRLRVETDSGTDLGILVDKPELTAGDVLVDESELAVVVAFEPREAFVIELPEPSDGSLAAAIELGHRIGNQHWGVAVEDDIVHVPVAADRRIIESVLGEYLPAGATTRYETVNAALFVEGGTGDDHGHGGPGHDARRSDHAHGDHHHGRDGDHADDVPHGHEREHD
ncbi:MAG: urease accessory protein UreE [Halobacteriota archaeon]|uniref:urease accessory protein UreE n=1 Tax=Natronomonas sp. TaxID=2184060 RepID=UPI0039755334